jgi:hypothetical protein
MLPLLVCRYSLCDLFLSHQSPFAALAAGSSARLAQPPIILLQQSDSLKSMSVSLEQAWVCVHPALAQHSSVDMSTLAPVYLPSKTLAQRCEPPRAVSVVQQLPQQLLLNLR